MRKLFLFLLIGISLPNQAGNPPRFTAEDAFEQSMFKSDTVVYKNLSGCRRDTSIDYPETYWLYSERDKKMVRVGFSFIETDSTRRVYKVEYMDRLKNSYGTQDLRKAFWIEKIRKDGTKKL